MTEAAPISAATLLWFVDQGVPRDMLPTMASLRVVRGNLADDGYLDLDDEGEHFVALYEEVDDDAVFWSPRTGGLARWAGRAFALGATDNLNAFAGALRPLRILADPLDWLRERGNGLVVVDWSQAFDRLRDVPAVAVAEPVLPQYRRAMTARVPRLSVIMPERRAAA